MPVTEPMQPPRPLWQFGAFLVIWCGGAALSHRIGIWGGIGGAAIGLALLIVASALRPVVSALSVTRRGLTFGLGGGAAMIAATYALFPLAASAVPGLAADVAGLYALFGSPPAWVVFGLLPLIILGEEIVWRGAALEAASKRLPPAGAAVAVGLIYGLAHLPAGSWLLALIAVGAGIYWGLLRWLSGSLLAPLIAHVTWDMMVLVLLPLNQFPR